MAHYNTNSNRILQAVLADEKLIEFGEYNPADYQSLDEALVSDNLVVNTVARIINEVNEESSSREIYNMVTTYLKNNI